MRATVTESVTLSCPGLSVVGIAKKILEYMETQDTTYPGQYEVDVRNREIKITRTYQKEVA